MTKGKQNHMLIIRYQHVIRMAALLNNAEILAY